MSPSPPRTRLLIIEDEARIAELLVTCFEREGYECEVARDGPLGLRRALADPPDLILLDLMLPGLDGVSVCRKIREVQQTPIVMVTARDQEMDKVLGLELGADDYVTKPFSLAELKARVRSLLRRSRITDAASDVAGEILIRGEIQLDQGRRKVTVRGKDILLTAREFDLLAFFMAHPGQVFSREQLLEKVWGYGHEGYGRTVDSHVTRLRKKVEEEPSSPLLLQTIWGVGYRFREEA